MCFPRPCSVAVVSASRPRAPSACPGPGPAQWSPAQSPAGPSSAKSHLLPGQHRPDGFQMRTSIPLYGKNRARRPRKRARNFPGVGQNSSGVGPCRYHHPPRFRATRCVLEEPWERSFARNKEQVSQPTPVINYPAPHPAASTTWAALSACEQRQRSPRTHRCCTACFSSTPQHEHQNPSQRIIFL